MTTPETAPTASPGTPRWAAWHLHLATLGAPATDLAVRHVVGPAVDWWQERRLPVAWFFVRYWQFGPHVRLRVAGLDDDAERHLDRLLEARLNQVVEAAPPTLTPTEYRRRAVFLAAAGEGGRSLEVGDLWPPGIYRQPYRPELDRYGGAPLMATSEALFQDASELALAFTRLNPPEVARAGLGLRATWAALGVLNDDECRRDFCHRAAAGWQSWAAIPDGEKLPAATSPVRLPGPPPAPLRRWADHLSQSMAPWRAMTSDGVAEQILHAHIHMLHNRLGLSIHQEMSHYLALAGALMPGALMHDALTPTGAGVTP